MPPIIQYQTQKKGHPPNYYTFGHVKKYLVKYFVNIIYSTID